MTEQEWLAYARLHKDKLTNLIGNYHPVNLQQFVGMKITAPNAEAASQVIRNKIKEEFKGNHPVTQFHKVLEEGNIDQLMSLLNSAWFGVPESTSCWQIEGFKEAVTLLEDPPED